MKITSATSLFITVLFLSLSLTSVLVNARLGDETDHDQIGNEDMTRHDLHPRYLAAQDGNAIEGKFFVTVEDRSDIPKVLQSLSTVMPECRVVKEYQHVLSGFLVSDASPVRMNRFIQTMERLGVEITVEEDSTVEAFRNVGNDQWGLDRIDQRTGFDNSFAPDSGLDGTGVEVFILDTGVKGDHQDFRGPDGTSRVFPGPNYSSDSAPSNVDQQGHGTHVASTAAGNNYGVAPGAKIWALKVLGANGSGSLDWSIYALDDIVAYHLSGNGSGKSVVNMSLGVNGNNGALNNAVNNAVSQGVVVVVAAGNSNANACNFTPARASNAITVGSTDRDDSRSSFSNHGTCVDIFAPGRDILAAGITSNTSTRRLSGTSMASPHVAGAAALLLQSESLSASAVAGRLNGVSTKGEVENEQSGSPDELLYVGDFNDFMTPPSGPAPAPTPVCIGTGCLFNSACCPGTTCQGTRWWNKSCQV